MVKKRNLWGKKINLQVYSVLKNTTNPEDVTIAKDTYNNYLIDLSPFEKKVFTHFLKGKRKQEIAKILNTTEDKVGRAIYRCAIKLKNIVYY